MSPASSDLLLSSPLSDSICLPCTDGLGAPLPQTPPAVSSIPSPSLPPPPVSIPTTSTNTHSMVTRGKAGIFKPKAYHAFEISPSSQFFQAFNIFSEFIENNEDLRLLLLHDFPFGILHVALFRFVWMLLALRLVACGLRMANYISISGLDLCLSVFVRLEYHETLGGFKDYDMLLGPTGRSNLSISVYGIEIIIIYWESWMFIIELGITVQLAIVDFKGIVDPEVALGKHGAA
ncbi:hypothetical protein F0562_011586 [Nyssa sinensis]|uniref:Uncharacterized protein n=1 Tax=Nyssa sinensis TaxID=561372 RepID=A0A5J4ZPV1_9ASTE|nr:hypothetical protein F0562_011586 [Nyssa sinensis]